jgi:peptide/nickel transport system ATP-binding protein
MTITLQIRDLSIGLQSTKKITQIISHVSLDVLPGEIIGIVGESGCGKSTLAIGALGLIETPHVLQSGSVLLTLPDGSTTDVVRSSSEALRDLRWRHIAYIPQGSMNIFNPVMRIRAQLTDTLVQHGMTEREALERATHALHLVNLKPSVLDQYPHELSGGMKQRTAIAAAISMEPAVLIADEPTTALDVVTQRMILQELVKIRDTLGVAIIIISHDMGVMAQVADRIAVMYAGRIIEVGAVTDIFKAPLHPYSQALLGSILQAGHETDQVEILEGESPNPWNYPAGCRFNPRCPHTMDRCRTEVPDLIQRRASHQVACHLLDEKVSNHG